MPKCVTQKCRNQMLLVISVIYKIKVNNKINKRLGKDCNAKTLNGCLSGNK